MRIGTALLGGFFVVAGVGHFLRPESYIGIVPPALPDPALLVALSGVAEMAGGVGVWLPATRRPAAIGLIVLLVAIFPANIYMLIQGIAAHRVWWWQAALWLRLPFQPLMIWWAWRVAATAGHGEPRALTRNA